MKTGACVAGVRREVSAVWIRPVRDFESVQLGDITYPVAHGSDGMGQRRVMRPFDVVELTLGHPRSEPPHVEDWTCDFAHARPRLLGVLPPEERAALLDTAACPPHAIWRDGSRSLGTLTVDDLTATFHHDTYAGKYGARLAFAGLPDGTASAPCTDLKWRALGRRLLAAHPAARRDGDMTTLTLAGAALREALAAERIWLAMGVTRNYHGHYWPFVVGVHALPDYEAAVDYRNL